jgi:predicted ATPase
LLETLPDVPQHTQLEFGLQTALGPALMATKGFAAPEVASAYARARELCQQVGDSPQLFLVLIGLVNYYNVRGELQTGHKLGEQLLGMAQRLQDPALLLEAHHVVGSVAVLFGDLVTARAHLQQALTLYNPHQHRSHAFLYGHDPRVCCLCFEASALWRLGYPDQALKSMQDALTFAQELGHPFSQGLALTYAAGLHQLRREVQATHRRAAELVALSREQGFLIWLPLGTAAQGWVLAEQGDVEEGIAKLRQGIDAYKATQAELGQPGRLCQLAAAYGKAGQTQEGLRVLTEAWEVVSRTGERLGEAELYRLKGELTLQSKVQNPKSKVEEAEECFLKAIYIARKQQARSWELRATVSLARLWQQQGKQHEAHKLLLHVYNWFTEGFDTKDLQEAKALLDELARGV